ncbi:MraY family glycosyltransferase [Chitinibacter sp. S2-10]|uniref:MraY family glycosyltransferase n=1 Tax=Chitinibacter sp. S2-10 TaxID=3373597 RepID=UPI0039775560
MLIAIFFVAFVASSLTAVILIHTQHLHANLSMDSDLASVQKFHAKPTPRIGGLPVAIGLIAAGILTLSSNTNLQNPLWPLLIASMPVFFAGLAEDLTKKITPMCRLLAAFLSAGLAAWLCNGVLPKLGLPGLDELLTFLPITALLFTIFAVGGVCHSINIIDGYNGLMAGVALAALAAFGAIALAVGDLPLVGLTLASAGAIAGFLVWNFPKGMIFAGDAGAYLIGFTLAEIAVLLIARHPDVISPWFPLLVLIYPVFETVFSIYRKKFIRQISPGIPDALHFHMLVYKRLVRWMVGSKEAKHLTRRNSLTAPYLWAMSMFSIMPAMIFWKSEISLQIFTLVFIFVYIWSYKRLIKFRAPRQLVLSKKKSN